MSSSMADVALTIFINKIENETRKPLEERNQELLAIWNSEIIRLTPVLPIQPTGKYFSLFTTIRIVSIFHSLYLSQLMICSVFLCFKACVVVGGVVELIVLGKPLV